MTKAETQHLRHKRGGFTMVEVVAAVAILGIWFTLLVTLVSDGVASETTSHIRLEASLLADEVLADAEATLLTGGAISPIALGEEHRFGDYTDALFDVVLTAEPFDALGNLTPQEGAFVPPEGLGINLEALDSEKQIAALSALLEIRVEVYASEADEFNVLEFEDETGELHPFATRTTYMIDPLVLASLEIEDTTTGGPESTPRGNDKPLGSDQ
ncbi:MAG: prepilin-type N-terminal cleavage/methylation domain-containing protein [Myxococcota bacterium]|nr:prepilin-type N-terminal cleavage/methylation domain-containing protein [Myxococcota bacterium]